MVQDVSLFGKSTFCFRAALKVYELDNYEQNLIIHVNQHNFTIFQKASYGFQWMSVCCDVLYNSHSHNFFCILFYLVLIKLNFIKKNVLLYLNLFDLPCLDFSLIPDYL